MHTTPISVRLPTAVLLAVWIGSYFGARALIPSLTEGSWARIGAAALPVVPTVVLVWHLAGVVRGLDELHRRVHLEALAAAFVLAVVTLWTLGLLELAVVLDRENWSYRHVWALLPVYYFVGLAVSWRRYR